MRKEYNHNLSLMSIKKIESLELQMGISIPCIVKVIYRYRVWSHTIALQHCNAV